MTTTTAAAAAATTTTTVVTATGDVVHNTEQRHRVTGRRRAALASSFTTNMAASSGWRTRLAALFAESRRDKMPIESHTIDVNTTKNVMDIKDGHIFLWDHTQQCVLSINLVHFEKQQHSQQQQHHQRQQQQRRRPPPNNTDDDTENDADDASFTAAQFQVLVPVLVSISKESLSVMLPRRLSSLSSGSTLVGFSACVMVSPTPRRRWRKRKEGKEAEAGEEGGCGRAPINPIEK